MKKYYSLLTQGREADIYIFGDITSWEWSESDVSSYTLSKELQGLDVDTINIHINSYGGEVAEGLAIYNLLRSHPAKIKTYCDGFACSVASVIFMAGDERIVNNASLLMIHNAWMYTAGNAEELRKAAADLDIITQASINAYLEHVNISETELKALLDAETWLLPEAALEKGFATSIIALEKSDKAAASAKNALFLMLKNSICTQEQEDVIEEPPQIEEDIKEQEALKEEEQIQIPSGNAENKTLNIFNALVGRKD